MSGFQVFHQPKAGLEWFLANLTVVNPDLFEFFQVMFFQMSMKSFDEREIVSTKLTNSAAFALVGMVLQRFLIGKTELTIRAKFPLGFGGFRMFGTDMVQHSLKRVPRTPTKLTWNGLILLLKKNFVKLTDPKQLWEIKYFLK